MEQAEFKENNPVFQDDDGKWWFWDCTWSDKYGPYETKESVSRALYTYCIYELGISKEEMKQYEPARKD